MSETLYITEGLNQAVYGGGDFPDEFKTRLARTRAAKVKGAWSLLNYLERRLNVAPHLAGEVMEHELAHAEADKSRRGGRFGVQTDPADPGHKVTLWITEGVRTLEQLEAMIAAPNGDLSEFDIKQLKIIKKYKK